MTLLKIKNIPTIFTAFLAICVISVFSSTDVHAAEYTFPVIGSSSYSNDYNAPRSGGPHHAIDIIAKKRQKIVSVKSGIIKSVIMDEPGETQGYMLKIKNMDDGLCYWYIHMNNDNPGTDDGKGGPMKAFAPDMKVGNPVKKGQLLGWVGDSGNSEGTVSHLHFEVVDSDNENCQNTGGNRRNPYSKLKAAGRIKKPVDYPQLPIELLPFNTWYRQKLNIARGNIAGNTNDETVVGIGYGHQPKVRVFDSNKKQIEGFYPGNTSAKYGADVALGDISGDSAQEIIVGYRTVNTPRIAVFERTQDSPNLSYSKVEDFVAFDGNTSPRVAAGNVDGVGKDEIIASKGRGSSPAVRIFDSEGNRLKTSFVVSRDFRGGLDVASADVTGDTKDEVVVSVLTDGSSFIRIFDQNFDKVSGDFYSYLKSHRSGVYISAGDIIPGGKAEIVTIRNEAKPVMRYYNAEGDRLSSFSVNKLEEWWEGYYDIAVGSSGVSTATGGNRRGSIR